MSTGRLVSVAVLLIALELCAQPPAIFHDGVSNSASRVAASLPFGGLAPGSRITIKGVRLEKSVLRVNQRKARTLKADHTSAEFLLPLDLPTGPAELIIEGAGGASHPFPVTIVASAFGIRTLRRVGRNMTLDGSGLGNGAQDIEVVVGGRPLRPSKIHSGAVGNDRIEFRLPAGPLNGCHLSVYVRSKSHVSNFVDLAGLPGCADEPWPILAPAPRGSGSLILIRSTLKTVRRSWTADSAQGVFFRSAKPLQAPPLWFPLGTGQCRLESAPLAQSLHDPLGSLRLDKADLKMLIPGQSISIGTRNVPVNGAGAYISTLGGTSPLMPRPKPLFFEPGRKYGIGVPNSQPGRFSADVPFIDDLEFSLAATGPFDGSVKWRTSQPLVAIVIYSQNDYSSVEAVCAAKGSDGALTIPSDILRSLPTTITVPGALAGYVGVAALSAPAPFTAAGVKKSIVTTVRFRIDEAEFK